MCGLFIYLGYNEVRGAETVDRLTLQLAAVDRVERLHLVQLVLAVVALHRSSRFCGEVGPSKGGVCGWAPRFDAGTK